MYVFFNRVQDNTVSGVLRPEILWFSQDFPEPYGFYPAGYGGYFLREHAESSAIRDNSPYGFVLRTDKPVLFTKHVQFRVDLLLSHPG